MGLPGRAATLLLGMVLVASSAAPARASWWPWGSSRAQERLDAVADARKRGALDEAEGLLNQAEASGELAAGQLAHERGLLAWARGDAAAAEQLLGQAARREPASDARVDLAALQLGRNNRNAAVASLRQAFSERGDALAADKVAADPRFAPLADEPGFLHLMQEVRAAQAGPLGRLGLALARVEASLRSAAGILERLGVVLSAVWRLMSLVGAPVVALIFLCLLATFGVNQLGLLGPPWTLVAGTAVGSLLWHVGERVVTANASGGLWTIATAVALLFAPWIAVTVSRWSWRRFARVARSATDPFGARNLAHTLEVLEEVQRQGRRVVEAGKAGDPQASADLQHAAEALRRRLG